MRAYHYTAFTCDLLKPAKFLTGRRKRYKPALYFEPITEAGAIYIFNVIMQDIELSHFGCYSTFYICFPARIVQYLNCGGIIQMAH